MFTRPIRQARLLELTIPQPPRDVIPSLFDPQLVRMLDNRMLLHGYQIYIDMESGATKHCAQVWVVRPAADEQQPVGTRIAL